MAHMTEKWLEKGKGTEKWHKIRVIAEGKMVLSWVVVSLNTSIIERKKCEGKSIVRCSKREKIEHRLYDREIVKEWVQNKRHHYVYESKTFSKSRTWCKLMITLIRRALAECKNHLVFGHSPQTLTSEVVRMLYPQNTEHIGYQLWCDNNGHISNVSMKERYWNRVHACWSKSPKSAWKDM